MPPAGRGLAPCTPFIYFFLHTRSHQLKRSGVGRARAVGCLTEPGIVCFPAVPRTTRCFLPEAQGREALRGPRGSSGRPCPVRAGTRLPAKAMPPAGRGTRPLHPIHIFLSSHPFAPAQAFWRGPGKSCRLFDRAKHRLLLGRAAHNALLPARSSRSGSITRPAREFRQTLPGPRRNATTAKGMPPASDEMRLPQNAWLRRTGDASPSPHHIFLHPIRKNQKILANKNVNHS